MTRSRSWFGALLAVGTILAAGGCVGTDFLNTGNASLRIEVAAVGTPVEDWECLIFELDDVKIRPLDGRCDSGSANADEPCLNNSDCDAGTGQGECIGSNAGEVIGNAGIVVVPGPPNDTVPGNLLPGPCQPQSELIQNCCSYLNRDTWKAPPSFIFADGLYEISTSTIRNLWIYRDRLSEPFPDLRQCKDQNVSMPQWLGEGALRFTMDGTDKVIRYEVDIAAVENLFQFFDGETVGNCTTLRNQMTEIIECTTCDAGVAP